MPAYASEAPAWPRSVGSEPSGSYISLCSTSSSGSDSSRPASPADWAQQTVEPRSWLTRVLGWYPMLVLRLARQMISVALIFAWTQIFLSTGLCVLDYVLKIPLSITKCVLNVLYGSRGLGRTILVTGSSLETLHVARNYYQNGLRVVVAKHDDEFGGLVRFSTAVDKFYVVPSPQKHPHDYVRQLGRITELENVSYFLPTSISNTGYFDALARTHLEAMGVKCICAGPKEVCLCDDPLSMFQLCHDAGLPTPWHIRVTNLDQVASLYEDGYLRGARHILLNAGTAASIRDFQTELELPQTRRGFRRLLQIQPRSLINLCTSRPALILQLPHGDRLVTCTTVKEGRLVANVTCRAAPVHDDAPPLVPLKRDDVDQWLSTLFKALPSHLAFSGHVTFILISTRDGLVPVRARVGVSPSYLCYTRQQPRLLLRPCKHQSACQVDRNSLVLQHGRYWFHELLHTCLKAPGLSSLVKFISTILCQQEALYSPWDPIPSCIYYGVQAPAQFVLKLVQASQKKVLKQHQVKSSCEKHSVCEKFRSTPATQFRQQQQPLTVTHFAISTSGTQSVFKTPFDPILTESQHVVPLGATKNGSVLKSRKTVKNGHIHNDRVPITDDLIQL